MPQCFCHLYLFILVPFCFCPSTLQTNMATASKTLVFLVRRIGEQSLQSKLFEGELQLLYASAAKLWDVPAIGCS